MGRNGASAERLSSLLLRAMVLVLVMVFRPEIFRGADCDNHPTTMKRRQEAVRTSPLAAAPIAPSRVVTNPPPLPHLNSPRLFSGHAQISLSPSSSSPKPASSGPRVYHVTDYGADPTGALDSTDAINRAIADAFTLPPSSPPGRVLMPGVPDLGGAEVHLDGGSFLVSSPIRLPSSGGGNFRIHGGSLVASSDFAPDGYLIELRSSSPSPSYDYEFVTLRDLLLDANHRCGGIAVINSLRTSVDNVYVTHFTTDGILVHGGHETYIRSSYLGQEITAGASPSERNFSGTAINLAGNDNAVTDVAIFSAAVGVLVAGQANTLTNVHCYNKAAGWGGVGIYVRVPGLTQTRILNCYMDYTGIVAEDPVQLHVSGTFFLGDACVALRAVKGVMRGVTIVDNMFSGSGKGEDIVRVEGRFEEVEGVVVERNDARGMNVRSTSARGSARGDGTAWEVDFGKVLLFNDRIDHVLYSLVVDGAAPAKFVGHGIRNLTGNRVVVEADAPVSATVHVEVDQAV